jgi:hypothetical protein
MNGNNRPDPLTAARIDMISICDEMAIRLLDLSQMLERNGKTLEANKMRHLAVENLQARIRISRRLVKRLNSSQ